MSIEVKVPQLPESVADATLVAWHKSRATSSSATRTWSTSRPTRWCSKCRRRSAGVMRELRVQDGATVTSGQLLALLEEGCRAAPAAQGRAEAPPPLRGAGGRSAQAALAEGRRAGEKLAPSRAAPGRGAQARRRHDPAAAAVTAASPRATCCTHLAAAAPASAPAASPPASAAGVPAAGARTSAACR